MEIDVSDGENAKSMVACAKENLPAVEVEYCVFDVFERSWSSDADFERTNQKLLKTGA